MRELAKGLEFNINQHAGKVKLYFLFSSNSGPKKCLNKFLEAIIVSTNVGRSLKLEDRSVRGSGGGETHVICE